mmetsp:Transcript_37450/g.67707  ORF Transcript_37450/g.67707 Transcript_37450/m.67707 type:complete len:551 (+) Transcript_37450:43-1695(+)
MVAYRPIVPKATAAVTYRRPGSAAAPPPQEEEIDPWDTLGEEEAQEEEDDGLHLLDIPLEEEQPEEDIPRREDDLDVNDVAEDMREAVEGNLRLKRLLSGSDDGEATSKKRKLSEVTQSALEPEKQRLLTQWRLGEDRAARYVMQAATIEEVRIVARKGFRPTPYAPQANGRDGKSPGEQLNEQLLRAREESFCPGGNIDVVTAFKHKWSMSQEDEKVLRNLSHKDLRHVLKEFDGTRSVSELIDEAAMIMPNEDCDVTEEAAAEQPGLKTMSRFNRLELIDPNADALVIGDANLTFSEVLAKHREALGHVGRIVATTFETIEILRERYTEIDQTVQGLEEKNAEVLHNVDGTRLAVDPRFQGMEGKFGAVYYNFPHAGVVQGFFDGHPFVRWRHENLMHLFFRALRGFVKHGGIVKVSSNMGATGVRYSDIISAAHNSEFVHVETIPFMEWHLRSYNRSYGDRRDANRRPGQDEIYKNQRAHSDMVYAFRYEPTGEAPPKALIRRPPTKEDLLRSSEGKLRALSGPAKQKRAEEIYDLFLTYVQGIHVG